MRLIIIFGLCLATVSADELSTSHIDALIAESSQSVKTENLDEFDLTDWATKRFIQIDRLFDGGSLLYSFKSSEGENFSIKAVYPYSGKCNDKQVFHFIVDERVFEVTPGSKGESTLVALLKDTPRLVALKHSRKFDRVLELIASIETRKSLFTNQPR